MTEDVTSPGARSKWARFLVLALWALLAAGLGYLATLVDWRDVYARARAADPWWLCLGIFFYLLAMPFWSLTWVLLARQRLHRFWCMLEVQMVTLASVQSFSLIVGGATAVLMLTRRAGLSHPATLSLITLDQLVTGIVKVIIVVMAVTLAHPPGWMQQAGWSLLGVILLGSVGLAVAHHFEARLQAYAAGRPGRLLAVIDFIGRTASHLQILRDPLRSTLAVLLMLARRLIEGIPVLCVQKAVGIPVSWELALLVITALALVTVIPQPPGNAGLYEAAILVVYQAAGIPADLALAAALLQHAIFLVAALVPGYLVLLFRKPWRRVT